MEAREVSWHTMYNEHLSCAEPLPPKSMNHTVVAQRYVKRLRHHVLCTGKRKSAPRHSIPIEVIAMALAPSWKLADPSNVSLLGLGCSRKPELSAPLVWTAFVKGYQHINRSMYSPLKWHLSWGAVL